MSTTARRPYEASIVRRAIRDAFAKLHPRHMIRNPVMFVVLVGSVLTTLALVHDLASGDGQAAFTLQLALWLWFTVIFANFAEAMAEGRGKAQAESLRRARTETTARRLADPDDPLSEEPVPTDRLRKGDVVLCGPGDTIPGDGEVIEGVASVDESAITGESAPVIRESGG
ncbi:MAG TPA: potassium-transporting ATPase subunit B, partial [Gemmatimonadaceae bacterium]